MSRRQPLLPVCLIAFVMLAFVGPTPAESPESAVTLQVSGPSGCWISLSVRYFSGDEQQSRWSTDQQRLQLVGGNAVVSLKDSHDGYAIDLFSTTKQPLKIKLSRDDTTLEEKQSDGVGHTLLKTGIIGSLIDFKAEENSLAEGDQMLAKRFLDAFHAQRTSEVVSESNLRNIDCPSLDAFAEVAQAALGNHRESTSDGWMTWTGKQGSTIYAGPLRFQRGTADVLMVMLDEKLVDFVFKSDRLPTDWYVGPASIEQYAAQGETLIRLMFIGDVVKAREIFSPRTHQQVTVDRLRPIHESLVDRFGATIKSIQLREHTLEKATSEEDRKLVLHYDLVDEHGKNCDATVDILLDRTNGLIPRAHVAAFNVRQRGPSIPPEAIESMEAILVALIQGNAQKFTEQLPEEMIIHLSDEQLKEELSRWQAHFGRMTTPIDWSQWTDTEGKQGMQGPIGFAEGDVQVRIDFAAKNMLGVTVVGASYAGSTLDCVKNTKPLTDHAMLFWRQMYSGNMEASYEMLPDGFQKQLSREQFAKMTGKLAELKVKIRDITVRSVRFDSKPNREAPIMIECICLVRFDDNTYQSGKCEYHVKGPDEFGLYAFNSEFERGFPVPIAEQTDFVAAVASGDPSNVMEQFHDVHKKDVDRRTLAALMVEIQKQYGTLVDLNLKGQAIRSYENGSEEITRVKADLKFEGATVPTEWTCLYGHLKSFHFKSSELQTFAKNITDTNEYRARSEELFKTWFAGDVKDAVKLLAPQLHNQESETHMLQLKNRMIAALGKFDSVEFREEAFDEKSNRLRQEFELKCANGSATGTVQFAFDALHAYLVSAELAPIKAEGN